MPIAISANFLRFELVAEEVDKEVSRVNRSAPSGEQRRLLGPELNARGLDAFSTTEPSISKSSMLPDWDHSGRNLWPPRRTVDPALFAPHPYNPRYSAERVEQELEKAESERRAFYGQPPAGGRMR